MLQRDRQMRTQIHELLDGALFALSFLAAYALRANPQVIAWLKLDRILPPVSENIGLL